MKLSKALKVGIDRLSSGGDAKFEKL